MLLQELVAYSYRLDDIPPAMYNNEPVYYWIELDAKGGLLGIVPVEPEERKRPKKVSVPSLVRASGVKAKLLADNAEYVLGLGRETSKPERVVQCHQAFVEMVDRCAVETGEVSVHAVVHFLLDMVPENVVLPDDFDGTRTMAFRVDGTDPMQLPSVQSWWMRAAGEGRVMQCLVCGNDRPAMERLQIKLKGIPGGQASGLAIISANEDAYLSYGLEASYTAPTCQDCSDRFMKAANALVSNVDTRLRIGNAVYAFWTREATSFQFATMFARPEPQQVRALLERVWGGGETDLDPTPFYAVTFSASGGRAVIRDWIDTTVGRAQEHLARLFALQRVVDAWGDEGRPLGVYGLAGAVTRKGEASDAPTWVSAALMHVALAGGPLPASLLFKAVERCRMSQDVTHERAALIKMVLLSRNHESIERSTDTMIELDQSNRSPAYLCGRLFAELEQVQRAALGDVGASIVDRFYGTASSAPATVFGRLVKGAQPHLAKLHRDRQGAYRSLQARLEEIMENVQSFPTTLNLEEQGLFALGYYHQRAADRASARSHHEGISKTQPQSNTEEEEQ